MTSTLSPNTEAILLLTAPLIAGKGEASHDLLKPAEYNRLVRHLQDNRLKPADLVSPDAADAIRTCEQVIEANRLARLLGRGFLLAQAFERWQSGAIWVLSRSDAEYPRILKSRLKNDAPSVLYGCGDPAELTAGGLAVVGSRHVDDELVEYAHAVGTLAARSGRTIVSGGAKGIDQAAMHGALDAGGRAIGVLADSLEKAVLARYNRDKLLSKQLTLVSPFDPAAGFNVGNAMRRNKFIYALSNASLVVSSDVEKGGTWAGAVEQLTKLKLVPVYVRSSGPPSDGLEALTRKGARGWPNPDGVEGFQALLDSFDAAVAQEQPGLPFPDTGTGCESGGRESGVEPVTAAAVDAVGPGPTGAVVSTPSRAPSDCEAAEQPPTGLDDRLFDVVRELIRERAGVPVDVGHVAAALAVTDKQAQLWVIRLLKEGALEEVPGEHGFMVKAGRVSTG